MMQQIRIYKMKNSVKQNGDSPVIGFKRLSAELKGQLLVVVGLLSVLLRQSFSGNGNLSRRKNSGRRKDLFCIKTRWARGNQKLKTYLRKLPLYTGVVLKDA